MLIFVHYTSCQPLSVPSYEDNDILASDGEANEESIPKLFFIPKEYDQMNQPNSSEPIRRANFWKRANFWRKRANFWRRDLAV